MSLLYSVALLAASAVIGRVFYIGNRLPRVPWWSGSGMTMCFNLLITAMIAMGIGFILEIIVTWEGQVIGSIEVLLTSAIVAAAVVLWIALGRGIRNSYKVVVVPAPQAVTESPDHDGGHHPTPVDNPSVLTRRAA